MCHARRDDHRVVRHLAVGQTNDSAVDVDGRRLGEPDLYVALPPEDPPDRRRDVAGRQPRRRDLIEQRLEDVVVAPVEQQDVDRRLRERARRAQPREPSPDDDDARP
jgi:hypothetical protein